MNENETEFELNYVKDNGMIALYVSYAFDEDGTSAGFDWDNYDMCEIADDIRCEMDTHRQLIEGFFDRESAICSVYYKLRKARSFMKKKGDARVYGKWSILTFKSNGYSKMGEVIEKLKQMGYTELPVMARKSRNK